MTASIHNFHRGNGATRSLPMLDALDAEQAVLGTVLLNNDMLAAIAPHVDVEGSGEDLYRRIFSVAQQLVSSGRPASPARLRPYLGDAELADGVTIGSYLAQLAADATPPVTAPGAARLIRNIAARRRLSAAAVSRQARS